MVIFVFQSIRSKRVTAQMIQASALAITLGLATPSHSQTASRAAASTNDNAEIIVTAQKREERLTDVPIAISALGGKALDRASVTDAVDALRTVPGVAVTVTNQGGTPSVTIRGVGATNSLVSGSSAVAYYLDGIPFSFPKFPIVPNTNVFDLNRVEVLRGPQGTLYGASALSGVVSVITNDADLTKVDVKARAGMSAPEHSSHIGYRGDLTVNVPLIEDKLAVRATVGYQKIAGTIDSPLRDDLDYSRLQNYRLKINAKPTERLSIGLTAWRGTTYAGSPTSSNDAGVYPFPVESLQKSHFNAFAGHLGYDFDSFTVQSTTSYVKFGNTGYLQQFPTYTNIKMHSFSEEMLVNSASEGPIRWSAGGIYRKVKDDIYVTSPIQFTPVNFYDKSGSYAFFGEVTWAMFDSKLELTGGGRYFHEKIQSGENTRFFATAALQAANMNRALIKSSDTFHSFTPRAVLAYHPNSNSTIYASYSKGFRSGFAQYPTVLSSVPGFPNIKPDKLTNYEIGAKGDLFDRKVSVDASFYYIDWQNIQQTLLVPAGTSFVTAPINGKSASGYGFDLGLAVRPAQGLTLRGDFSVNTLKQDAEIRVGAAQVLLFNKGDRLPISPKYTAGAGADYEFGLTDSGYKARLSASMNYTSKMQVRNIVSGALMVGTGDNITTVRTSATIEAPSNWSITFYIENLTDNNGVVFNTLPLTNPSAFAYPSNRLRPRTFGFDVSFKM